MDFIRTEREKTITARDTLPPRGELLPWNPRRPGMFRRRGERNNFYDHTNKRTTIDTDRDNKDVYVRQKIDYVKLFF